MLKVMTLNVGGYGDKHGTWKVRRGLIQAAMAAAQPDVVALQAVACDQGQSGGVDQAAQLAEGSPDLAYPHVYFQPGAAAVDGRESGNAFLSRLPFASQDSLRLSLRPGLQDTTRRVLLMASFDLPAGPLHVFNAHFSWVHEQLEDNITEALPWINEIQSPALLVGDLNAPAGEGLLYLLSEAGWVDAWEALRGDQPGYTFEAGQPSIRIDYAWANPFLVDRLRSIEVICDQAGPSGEHVSDHYGLLVGLDF
jgi:endonuclease/exonuclease/phosphatase family metal-dependent hydrolase